MLMFMRALPGRASRATLDAPPASVTRTSAHADQRRRILRAIGELVAERGYSDVTVELIVKRAHVSFKTFYKHFAGKEECFVALFESRLREHRNDDPPPPRRRAPAVARPGRASPRTLIEQIVAEPVIARAVIVESPTVGPAITERYRAGDQGPRPALPRRPRVQPAWRGAPRDDRGHPRRSGPLVCLRAPCRRSGGRADRLPARSSRARPPHLSRSGRGKPHRPRGRSGSPAGARLISAPIISARAGAAGRRWR